MTSFPVRQRNMTQATRPKPKPLVEGEGSLPLEVVDAILWEIFIMQMLDALLSDTIKNDILVQPCKVTTIGNDLPTTYQAAFFRITELQFEDGGLPSEIASLKLAEAGIQIGSTTIARHRRNACRCPRKG